MRAEYFFMQMPLVYRYCMLCVLCFSAFGTVVGSPDSPEPLTRVEQIRALSRAEAERGLPVKLQATVAYRPRAARAFIVYDGKECVSVHLFRARELGLWKGGDLSDKEFELGALLEIEGITGPAGYSPVIVPLHIRRMGSGEGPPPRQVPMERLISGSEVSQRVELEGVVQKSGPASDGRWTMRMMVDGHPCDVDFQSGDGLDAAQTVGSRIRVRGFFSPVFNLRSEFSQLRLLAWGKEDITILEPPLADPFAAPHRALNGLMHFAKTPDRFQRKVTAGTVNFIHPGKFFFLQDGAAGLLVESSSDDLSVGDRVEVSGFVDNSKGLASMNEALTRKLGHVEPPPPAKVTAKMLLMPEVAGLVEPVVKSDYFGCLVEIRGRLRQIERRSREGVVVLLMESDGEIFRAQLPADPAGDLSLWQEGSDLLLRGVCELEFAPRKPGTNSPLVSSFSLWLRSPEDVTVVKGPPWWTPRRLALALLGIGAALLLALAWIFALRRLLVRRTNQLEEVMRAHRDVELEYTSARRERLRLAVDLHDGLRQLLSAVSFRMDAAAGHLPESPDTAVLQLDAARNALDRTQTELQECLWGLHAVSEGPSDLVHLLAHVTERSEVWPAEAVSIKAEGATRDLPRHIIGSLLLLFQEAVGNAFKHGAATHIDVTVRYGDTAFEMQIVDDGRGFDPACVPGIRDGHFGLDGMNQRVQWLRGTLIIRRQEGGGMEVHIGIPWSAIPDSLAQQPVPASPASSAPKDHLTHEK